MDGSSRRWAILVLPAALVGLGSIAQAAASAAFSAFIGYRAPFRFSAVPQRALPALSERVVLVLLDGLGAAQSRRMAFLNELRARGASYECRSGLPSLSLPARAVLMTGAWQDVNGLLWTRVASVRAAGRAAVFALAGAAAYHLSLPLAGLSYSLTAVNKDEWLQRFFVKDMALGVLACAAAVSALCLAQRRRGADLLALCRQAWSCSRPRSPTRAIRSCRAGRCPTSTGAWRSTSTRWW